MGYEKMSKNDHNHQDKIIRNPFRNAEGYPRRSLG
jgi:hypothetical protein